MIYSFDVFDTVITRVCGHPFGVFVAMANAIETRFPHLPASFSQEFPVQRVKAEKNAREATQREEVTLDEIYACLTNWTPLTKELRDSLQFLEIDTELRFSLPVPAVNAEIHSLVKQGHRVIFVSDFYHSAETVRAMLANSGISADLSQLYVSSEIGVTKASGNLFRHVIAKEQCGPGDILHAGDNRFSDIRAAEKLGIHTRHITDGQLTRRESIFSNSEQIAASSGLLHHIAGASRRARLQEVVDPCIRNRTLYDIGSSVAGPLLVPFVSWIITRAIDAQVEKLYFVARDGQILKLIADRLIAKWGVNLATGYLYGSRQAWHLPAIRNLGDRELAWILNLDRNTSFKSLATRLEMDAEEFCGLVRERIARVIRPESPVLDSDVAVLGECIRNKEVSSRIFEAAERARKGMIGYLAEAGVLDHKHIGMVDIGWHGNLQTSLVTVLESLPEWPRVTGWYLGLRSGHPYARKDMVMESFLFGPERPDLAHRVMKNSGFFEIFCAADHGGTVGYKKLGDGWGPYLNPLGGQDQVAWGLADLRQGILRFAEHFDARVTVADQQYYVDAAARLIDDFVTTPSQSEAVAIGSFPFSTDQNDSSKTEFAPVLKVFSSRFPLNDIYRHDRWFAGVLMRSNPASLCVRALLVGNREVFIHGLRRMARHVRTILGLR